MCLSEVSSEWGWVFAAWWACSDLLLHQFLSPDLCSLLFLSPVKRGIAHLFHSSRLVSLLYTCLPQFVSEILWGLPVMFFPSNSNSGFLLSAKVTQNCALGTPTPQYMHVQLAKWMQEPEFRMQLGYFALQTGAVSWSRHSLNDFPFAHWVVITVQLGIAWATGNSAGHTIATFIDITAKPPTEKAPTLTPSGITGKCRVYKVWSAT